MDKLLWTEFWEKCSGTVYQSWEWAKLNKACGREPVFVVIEENGLKAGMLCFATKLRTPLGEKKILFSEGSPLYTNKDYLAKLLLKFKEESKDYFYGYIRPTFYKKEEFEGLYKVSNHTIVVNLSPEIEELFGRLEKKSARWGVKKAEKEGVVIAEEYTDSDISNFYKIYRDTAENQFLAEPEAFFSEIKNLEEKGLAKLLIAKHNNELIGGALLLLSKDYGVVSLTSISEEGMKLQAMNLLYWEMIKQCKENGKKFIDLGGYSEDAKKGSKMHNINQFKENFGGVVTEQPAYSTSKKYVWMFKVIKKFGFLKKFYKKEK